MLSVYNAIDGYKIFTLFAHLESFKLFLENHLSISETDWKIIESRLQKLNIPKFFNLTECGQVEDKLYFILDGMVRLFYDADHKEITINFAFPNSFIGAYTSFLTGSKSEYYLQSLTDCRLVYFTKTDLEYVYEHTQCGHHLGRIFAENLFLYLSKREDAFMMKSPTERYLTLFEEHPRLIQDIPQKYLASYIGITPQALSRIRANL